MKPTGKLQVNMGKAFSLLEEGELEEERGGGVRQNGRLCMTITRQKFDLGFTTGKKSRKNNPGRAWKAI